MDMVIGSNLYRNADGTVEIEGLPQITVVLRKSGGPLVSFVAYDDMGRVTGKIIDSTMAFNERRALELTKSATGVLVRNTETGRVVLQVDVKEDGRVVIPQAEFLTVKAHLLKVTPTEWTLEQKRMSGGDSDLGGKPVAIG
ncbi:hypothetical protein [Nitrospira sp. Kam-Ns4a]